MKKLIAVIFLAFASTSWGQQMIIFDLGGVLLYEAENNLLTALPTGLDIELIDGKPPKIFNRLFEFAAILLEKTASGNG